MELDAPEFKDDGGREKLLKPELLLVKLRGQKVTLRGLFVCMFLRNL